MQRAHHALVFLHALVFAAMSSSIPVPYVRIPPDQRKFSSPAIEAVITNISSRMRDQDLANLFSNCYPNTLDTTVSHHNASLPDTFIITGDINAQWLRDSTNQVLPYIPYAVEDPALQALICGLIQRQSRDILHDSYANAFNYEEEGGDHQDDIRLPPMTLHVFEALICLLQLHPRHILL